MVKIDNFRSGNLDGYVVPKSNYMSMDYSRFDNGFIGKKVDLENLRDYVNIDSLNTFTKEITGRKRFSIEKLIEKDEISCNIFTDRENGTEIMHIDCDSDTYRLTLVWFINLTTGEVVISDM
jgi:hypothetical protein